MDITRLIQKLKEALNIEPKQDSIEAMNETIQKIHLNEMSIAWVDRETNKCCWVENPTGYNNKYFKYVNSFSYKNGDKLARISLLHPQYLNHTNSDGKKHWILNNKEKKELIKTMQEPCRDFPQITNWQKTLAQYNLDNFGIYIDETINGTFDKKKYPDAFDVNYPMPDYTQL